MPSEESRKTARPAYAPVKGVREFFEKVTAKQPPAFINKDFLTRLGVAANNEQHVVAALRFLRLIDDEGRPTRQFDVLYMKSSERRRGLQNMLREAYPGLFSGEVDLRKATREDIHDFFLSHYGLHGQMARKATALFLLLCGLASIPLSTQLEREFAGVSDEVARAQQRSGVRPKRTPDGSPTPIAASLAVTGVPCPIGVILTGEMTEGEIVALLRRVKRAIATVEAEA